MQFLSSLLLSLTAAAAVVAQNNDTNAFATGLLEALRANNLSVLAGAVEANAEALLPALQGGNKTVLAPSDASLNALGDVPTDALVATIAYHVLNGTVSVGDISADGKVIAASALTGEDYVQLPNNRTQVVVLGKQSGNNTAYVQQAGRNVSFAVTEDGPTYQNIRVQPIESVLSIPGNTSTVAGALGASQLAQLLQQLNLVEALDSTDAVTVFAPNNAAFQAAQDTIAAASPEAQTAVLLNHLVNGTVVYSAAIADVPRATTASGQEITLSANDTGAFVTSGNVTARIIATDYVASNGVIHVIDNVLVNTQNNPEAAASAASSAEAAAASETGSPAGVGSNGGSSGGSTPPNNENSAHATKIGGGIAALAVLASGMLVLA